MHLNELLEKPIYVLTIGAGIMAAAIYFGSYKPAAMESNLISLHPAGIYVLPKGVDGKVPFKEEREAPLSKDDGMPVIADYRHRFEKRTWLPLPEEPNINLKLNPNLWQYRLPQINRWG